MGSIPGSGRSPGEGNGKHSSIPARRIPMDRGAWQATVHRLPKSRTRLKQLSMHAGYLVSELNLVFFYYLFLFIWLLWALAALWHMESFFSVTACTLWIKPPKQGLSPLHCEHKVLANGPPEKSQQLTLILRHPAGTEESVSVG